jgi:hypothetical protein
MSESSGTDPAALPDPRWAFWAGITGLVALASYIARRAAEREAKVTVYVEVEDFQVDPNKAVSLYGQGSFAWLAGPEDSISANGRPATALRTKCCVTARHKKSGNLSVRPVTARAGARPAPTRHAGHAPRSFLYGVPKVNASRRLG